LLRWLKDLSPEGKGLADSLHRFARIDVPRGLALLITDGLDASFPDALRQLAMRGHELILLHILSDAEWSPALEG
jgi:hypothetical protein